MKLNVVVPFLVMFLLDMAALGVSVLAGVLAMPLGGVYGSILVGATVFGITWRTLGSSKAVFERKFNKKG